MPVYFQRGQVGHAAQQLIKIRNRAGDSAQMQIAHLTIKKIRQLSRKIGQGDICQAQGSMDLPQAEGSPVIDQYPADLTA